MARFSATNEAHFDLTLNFNQARAVVDALKSARNMAENDIRYNKNRIQKEQGVAWADVEWPEDYGDASYYWRNLRTSTQDLEVLNGVLDQFGMPEVPEPPAEKWEVAEENA